MWANENLNKELCKKVIRRQKQSVRLVYFGKLRRQSCRGIFKKLSMLTITPNFYITISYLCKEFCLQSKTETVAH